MDIKERKTDILERKTPWYAIRWDPLGSCKTGEVVEPATKPQRAKTVLLGLVLGGLAIGAMQLGFKPWLQRRTEEFQVLTATDAVAGALQWAKFSSGVLLVPVVLAVAAAIWALVTSLRALRAGRWPLPGATVTRRTEVIGGWCLYVRFGVFGPLLMGAALMVWYNYIQLIEMFWNSYLDRRAAVSVRQVSRQNEHVELNGKVIK